MKLDTKFNLNDMVGLDDANVQAEQRLQATIET